MTRDEIRQFLEFYQDLGVKTIYQRGSALEAQHCKGIASKTLAQLVRHLV